MSGNTASEKVKQFRYGMAVATIFKNETVDGKVYYDVAPGQLYTKEGEGGSTEFKIAKSIAARNVPDLIFALQDAYRKAEELRQADRKAERQQTA